MKARADGYYVVSVENAQDRMPAIDLWLIEQAKNGVRFRVQMVWRDFQLLTKRSEHALLAKLRWC